MAIQKETLLIEPLTEEQDCLVQRIERFLDEELGSHYEGGEFVRRIRIFEQQDDLRVKVELIRRYENAGWKFRWHSDSRDGDCYAVLC